MMPKIQHIISSQNHLGEGPIWDSSTNYLYWVDLFRNKIECWTPTNPDIHQTIAVDYMVSAIGLRKGGFILATNDGIACTDRSGQINHLFSYPRTLQNDAHSNDGAVDRQGRFWMGTASGSHPNNHLYRFNGDKTIHLMEENIGISNGIAWSLDDRIMYYVDSPQYAIYAYDFNPITGDIANRRIFKSIPHALGTPDGITVDEEGFIWCALWDGWSVIRISPEGDIVDEVKVPVQRPTSCTFGGENLGTLFITTARTGLSEEQLDCQPHAGDVFVVDVSICGLPENYYQD